MRDAVEVDARDGLGEQVVERGRAALLGHEVVASVLPITNGLEAIRDTLNGEGAGRIAANAAAEAGVLLGWLTLALATFGRFVGAGRRNGSLEFAS